MKTTLQHLVPKTGICDVCGEKSLLAFKCPLTLLKFGKCCYQAMLSSDAVLCVAVRNSGYSHPDPGQFSDL